MKVLLNPLPVTQTRICTSRFSFGHILCCVVAVVFNICFVYSIKLQQHNVWPNENRDAEMGVCVTDRGFKRNQNN